MAAQTSSTTTRSFPPNGAVTGISQSCFKTRRRCRHRRPLYLTNIHRLFDRESGKTPARQTPTLDGTDVSQKPVPSIPAMPSRPNHSHKRVMVLNDEAHHVWDPTLLERGVQYLHHDPSPAGRRAASSRNSTSLPRLRITRASVSSTLSATRHSVKPSTPASSKPPSSGEPIRTSQSKPTTTPPTGMSVISAWATSAGRQAATNG